MDISGKTIFCIFAHPDDEAFGPGGTIARLAKNNDVYLISATRGESGNGHSDPEKTGKIRSAELEKSAAILGVKKVFFLDHVDGTLSNNSYHKLAGQIEQITAPYKPEVFLTFEPHGVSGHIDHITVSMVTTFVFYRMNYTKKLLYYCLDRKLTDVMPEYFIYFPPGYRREEAGMIVDTSDVWDTKIKAMEAHVSQRQDYERLVKQLQFAPREDLFLVIDK